MPIRRSFRRTAAVYSFPNAATVLGVSLVMLAIGPSGANFLADEPPRSQSLKLNRDLLRSALGHSWVTAEPQADEWKPRFNGVAEEIQETFTDGIRPVHVYLGYYTRQRNSAEMVSSQNLLFDRRRWHWVGEKAHLMTVDGQAVKVKAVLLRGKTTSRVVMSWYWVDGSYTGNPVSAKLMQVKTRLLSHSSQGVAIALAADFHGSPDEATDAIERFIRSSSLSSMLKALAQA
jgi:EpsI family protein